MMSPEIVHQIQVWRQKLQSGEGLSMEEQKAAVKALRGDRVKAQATSAKSRATKATAKSKVNIDSDKLLDELGGL